MEIDMNKRTLNERGCSGCGKPRPKPSPRPNGGGTIRPTIGW